MTKTMGLKIAETTPETTETPAKTTRKRSPKKEKSIMELLNLDNDTRKMINDTMQQLNIDEKEFFTNASKMYARAVRGGATRNEADLAAIPTEELLNNSTYKTHTNRTEELATRAIRGIIKFNDFIKSEKGENFDPIQDTWAITASAIKQLVGGRDATIQEVLAKFETLINEHHIKIDGMIKEKSENTPNYPSQIKVLTHNKKANKRKIPDDINLSELIPNGIE